MLRAFVSLALAALLGSTADAADWPHWLGPASNGSSPETGLLTPWPAAGPKVVWDVPGGDGYSTVVVAAGRAISLVQRGPDELAIALDAKTGKELWKTPIGPAFKNAYGNGPRSTPWVDGDRVFAQSVTGPLVCLDSKSGQIVWQKHLLKDFNAKNITWGLSASPVVAGDLVLAIPGAKGAGVAAFDKATGAVVWKTGSDKAAYASPVVVGKQAVFFNASGLLAVSLDKGQELWRYPWKTEFDCNIATPLVVGGDSLFVSSGESVGCALLKLAPSGPPTVVWESKGKKSSMINYWATSVVHDGHLYGFAGEFSGKIHLRCLDLKDGAIRWTKEDFGKGSLALADGHLIVSTKAGDLALIRATPTAYEERSRVSLLGDNRTAPTLSDKRLYIRDRTKIVCLDVSN